MSSVEFGWVVCKIMREAATIEKSTFIEGIIIIDCLICNYYKRPNISCSHYDNEKITRKKRN